MEVERKHQSGISLLGSLRLGWLSQPSPATLDFFSAFSLFNILNLNFIFSLLPRPIIWCFSLSKIDMRLSLNTLSSCLFPNELITLESHFLWFSRKTRSHEWNGIGLIRFNLEKWLRIWRKRKSFPKSPVCVHIWHANSIYLFFPPFQQVFVWHHTKRTQTRPNGIPARDLFRPKRLSSLIWFSCKHVGQRRGRFLWNNVMCISCRTFRRKI